MPKLWDFALAAVSVLSMIFGAGIFWHVASIARWVGSTQRWMEQINKEVSSQGSMLQQVTKDLSRLDGFMEGKDSK